jgi:hypothetical protein
MADLIAMEFFVALAEMATRIAGALAEAMLSLLKNLNLALALGDAARTHVLAHFSAKRMGGARQIREIGIMPHGATQNP